MINLDSIVTRIHAKHPRRGGRLEQMELWLDSGMNYGALRFILYIKRNCSDRKWWHLNDCLSIVQFDLAQLLIANGIWLIEGVTGGCKWSGDQLG